MISSVFKVCFVCTGNICRSPMGEVIFRELAERAGLGEHFEVISRGTHGYHVGNPADPRTLSVLSAAGYQGESHRAAKVCERDLVESDLILALDRGHYRILQGLGCEEEKLVLLGKYDRTNPSDPDVFDPYYGSEQDFVSVLNQVVSCCESLLAELSNSH